MTYETADVVLLALNNGQERRPKPASRMSSCRGACVIYVSAPPPPDVRRPTCRTPSSSQQL
ncbi:uncharacterized protein SCHCODRAFT_02615359 [Schizophyllum commune H4-8]|uniref:uncharacterized protein n=1 Tax=Schizophyllum commune (strain H4-8 / FGSC 9210) TaxID=578458 RepID=UPI00215E3468|nr:uncharacterized protein SCHCODRAFT_02615359 [Schizophyllum commune H4-8]KAI5896617.1 hypothetical protein SCHCODRAFT_02615359 [Schizophyllum commune H4-8]